MSNVRRRLAPAFFSLAFVASAGLPAAAQTSAVVSGPDVGPAPSSGGAPLPKDSLRRDAWNRIHADQTRLTRLDRSYWTGQVLVAASLLAVGLAAVPVTNPDGPLALPVTLGVLAASASIVFVSRLTSLIVSLRRLRRLRRQGIRVRPGPLFLTALLTTFSGGMGGQVTNQWAFRRLMGDVYRDIGPPPAGLAGRP